MSGCFWRKAFGYLRERAPPLQNLTDRRRCVIQNRRRRWRAGTSSTQPGHPLHENIGRHGSIL